MSRHLASYVTKGLVGAQKHLTKQLCNIAKSAAIAPKQAACIPQIKSAALRTDASSRFESRASKSRATVASMGAPAFKASYFLRGSNLVFTHPHNFAYSSAYIASALPTIKFSSYGTNATVNNGIDRFQFSSFVSNKPIMKDALEECANHIKSELNTTKPDLCIVFASHMIKGFDDIPKYIGPEGSLLTPKACVGTQTAAVVSDVAKPKADTEAEEHTVIASASKILDQQDRARVTQAKLDELFADLPNRFCVNVIAAKLPNTTVVPFYIENETIPQLPGIDIRSFIIRSKDKENVKNDYFIIFSDGLKFDEDLFTQRMDWVFPNVLKIGGLASGSNVANKLLYNNEVHEAGAVGLYLSGAVSIDMVYSQGTRPVGPVHTVTAAEGNVLETVDFKTMDAVLRSLRDGMTEEEKQIIQNPSSLLLGVKPKAKDNEGPVKPEDEFLTRNCLGFCSDGKSLLVGERLEKNQKVQFRLKDPEFSAANLEDQLKRYIEEHGDASDVSCALVFEGAGRAMSSGNRDPEIVRKVFSSGTAIGGMLCNGELQNYGGKTVLNGFTASVALIRQAAASAKKQEKQEKQDEDAQQ